MSSKTKAADKPQADKPAEPPTPTWAEVRRMPEGERQTLLGESGGGDPERYARLVGIPTARTPSIQPPRY